MKALRFGAFAICTEERGAKPGVSVTATEPHRSVLRVASLVGVLALAACMSEAPQPTVVRPAMPSPREMLAQVRTSGAADPQSLEVQPLRDPRVADLRARADRFEAQSDYVGAAQAIAQALALDPGDPELLQQSAEFALYRGDWTQAGAFAQQSFERGPKVGSLCRRNWSTLRFVRQAHGDAAGVQEALAQATACNVEPPARY
ncbi:MAG TPA: tetratricopeptide repeat protein [Xanthomonadaceae bacterium]|jgi:predicted Zn-dependent protease